MKNFQVFQLDIWTGDTGEIAWKKLRYVFRLSVLPGGILRKMRNDRKLAWGDAWEIALSVGTFCCGRERLNAGSLFGWRFVERVIGRYFCCGEERLNAGSLLGLTLCSPLHRYFRRGEARAGELDVSNKKTWKHDEVFSWSQLLNAPHPCKRSFISRTGFPPDHPSKIPIRPKPNVDQGNRRN